MATDEPDSELREELQEHGALAFPVNHVRPELFQARSRFATAETVTVCRPLFEERGDRHLPECRISLERCRHVGVARCVTLRR